MRDALRHVAKGMKPLTLQATQEIPIRCMHGLLAEGCLRRSRHQRVTTVHVGCQVPLRQVHEASDSMKACKIAIRAYWQGHAHGAASMKGCCSACRTLCSQAPQEARSSI